MSDQHPDNIDRLLLEARSGSGGEMEEQKRIRTRNKEETSNRNVRRGIIVHL